MDVSLYALYSYEAARTAAYARVQCSHVLHVQHALCSESRLLGCCFIPAEGGQVVCALHVVGHPLESPQLAQRVQRVPAAVDVGPPLPLDTQLLARPGVGRVLGLLVWVLRVPAAQSKSCLLHLPQTKDKTSCSGCTLSASASPTAPWVPRGWRSSGPLRLDSLSHSSSLVC